MLKSHVALYDPSTNVQLDTLSLPECPALQSAQFAGKGRYLVLAGARDLILWDVILQNGPSVPLSYSPHSLILCFLQFTGITIALKISPVWSFILPETRLPCFRRDTTLPRSLSID